MPMRQTSTTLAGEVVSQGSRGRGIPQGCGHFVNIPHCAVLSPENRGQMFHAREAHSAGDLHDHFDHRTSGSGFGSSDEPSYQGSPTRTQDALSPDFAKRNGKQVRYFCFVTSLQIRLLYSVSQPWRDSKRDRNLPRDFSKDFEEPSQLLCLAI